MPPGAPRSHSQKQPDFAPQPRVCRGASLFLRGSSVPPRGLAPLSKGSWQGRQALTEGLWVSDRNGLPITGHLLLHQTYNPSASHSLSTSPYTGEARGGRTQPACHLPRQREARRRTKSGSVKGFRLRQRLRCLPAKRASAASAAVLPQGAGFSGDRGGLILRGPRSACAVGRL